MIDLVCEHVWLIPPAAIERDNWRKQYRIKCRECSLARTVWGEFAQRMALAVEEKTEVATPKPKAKPRIEVESSTYVPSDHDFRCRKQGWGCEYLFGDNKDGTAILAAHFVKVKEGDTIILPQEKRYVVRKIVMPWGKDQSWIAEVERILL